MNRERVIREANEFVSKKEFEELEKYHNSMETFRDFFNQSLDRAEACGCRSCIGLMRKMRDEFGEEYARYQAERRRLTEVPSYDHEEEMLADHALAKIDDEHFDDPIDKRLNDWGGK